MLFSTTLLASLSLTTLAVPTEQLTFKALPDLVNKGINKVIEKTTDWIKDEVKVFETVVTEGITHQLIQHSDFAGYALRIKETNTVPVGDNFSNEKHYAGYLDIDSEAHIFFTFHESRGNPKNDPVSVFLNGGPGCSSQTGELFELGPYSIANGGENVTYNKYSWNEAANIIFIDSPTQVGFSYGSRSVSNSQDTARDLYAFLQLFYIRFSEFADNDLHLAGESYAGTYLPNIASFIHTSNLDLPTESSRVLPLKSVLIGNGLTDSKTQFGVMPDYACEGKFKIFDEETCKTMRSKVPQCQKLTQYCYDSPNRFVCVPATLSCWQIAGPIQQSGLNPYDVRRKCDREGEDGPLCYPQMQWIETRLNKPEIKKELGVSQDRTFESCNMKINQAFQFQGDVSHNTAALIPPLLEAGIRFLLYSGEADFLCNYVGNLAWTLALEWSGQNNFTLAEPQEMMYGSKKSPIAGGSTRSVGEGAGLFNFLQVYDAGHMVPYDQPEFSLAFFRKWINNEPFVKSA